ncbi:Protein TEX1 [Nakaseomyces bracarensis]|uniref:Protein TEX1 n=1 Tax=Nakaseomyces bracarensis TaxID=273131 RepID=A0ABR4NYC4_9SACH
MKKELVLKRKVLDSVVANEVAERFLENAFAENHVDSVEDERYKHVVTRKQSRFSSQLVPNEICALEFHPVGHTLAYSRMDGSLTIWPSISATFIPGKMIHVRDACGGDKVVTSVSWNPLEITQLISASNCNEVYVWEYDEAKKSASKVRTVTVGHRTKVTKALFDPHGKYVLAVTKTESLYLYSAKDEFTLVSTVNLVDIFGANDSVYSVTWDNSGENIIIGTKTGCLVVLGIEPSSKSLIKRLEVTGHRSSVSCLKVDPLGRFLVSGGADGSCNIWELKSFICKTEITGLNSSIISLDICHMGKLLGICLDDQRTVFCDLGTGKILYESPSKDLNSELVIRFFPDKTMFLLSGKNDTLQKHYFGSGKMNLLAIWEHDSHKNKDSKPASKISNKRKERKHGSEKPPPRTSRNQRTKRFTGNISKRR